MDKQLQHKPVIVALCGKGGVGKTSLSALIVRMFAGNPYRRVLAIDADPAVGLSYALGIGVSKTVDQIRQDLIENLGGAAQADRQDIIHHLEYDLFSALQERDNLAFLAVGRPEGDGCYCRVNALLREMIKQMAAQFDVVVIDGEAGLEQINRRVMEMVTHLLIVSDVSLKGRNVAETIYREGRKQGRHEKAGVIYNMLKNDEDAGILMENNRLPLIHLLHDNTFIRDFDREGRSFFDMPWSRELEGFEAAVRLFTGVSDAQIPLHR